MAGEDYDALTVPQLQNELFDRGLSTEGRKAELIDRLTKDDADDAEYEPEPETTDDAGVEVHAGGHVIHSVAPAPTPTAIETCSVHGAELVDGQCPVGGHEGTGWEIAEVATTPKTPDQDKTFWPDETRGPASAKGD